MIRVMAQLDMEGVYMRMLRMCERASCTTKVGVQILSLRSNKLKSTASERGRCHGWVELNSKTQWGRDFKLADNKEIVIISLAC